MGRIKSTLVKRTSKKLVQTDLLFGEEFEGNKKILGNTMPSKKLRNRIAGYIGHFKKMEKRHAEREAKRAAMPKHIQDNQEHEQEQYMQR